MDSQLFVSDGDGNIGEGTQVWYAVIREKTVIGDECIIGQNAYIDNGVTIGNRCKIQNGALIYGDCEIADGVFVGPGAIICNDKYPRAINPDGSLKRPEDWQRGKVSIGYGASIGAGAVILPGVKIGEWAVIAPNAVVTEDVKAFVIVGGIPAHYIGHTDRTGKPTRYISLKGG